MQVAFLVIENGGWDLDGLHNMLPHDIVDLFMSIKSLTASLGEDSTAWFPSSIGQFSLSLPM